ncbi:MAG: hypothetical protein HYS98_06495 [Deltaproteobacteria bacterium]|nr:hypothetical protein [Deltaproteobacteria bacterium]
MNNRILLHLLLLTSLVFSFSNADGPVARRDNGRNIFTPTQEASPQDANKILIEDYERERRTRPENTSTDVSLSSSPNRVPSRSLQSSFWSGSDNDADMNYQMAMDPNLSPEMRGRLVDQWKDNYCNSSQYHSENAPNHKLCEKKSESYDEKKHSSALLGKLTTAQEKIGSAMGGANGYSMKEQSYALAATNAVGFGASMMDWRKFDEKQNKNLEAAFANKILGDANELNISDENNNLSPKHAKRFFDSAANAKDAAESMAGASWSSFFSGLQSAGTAAYNLYAAHNFEEPQSQPAPFIPPPGNGLLDLPPPAFGGTERPGSGFRGDGGKEDEGLEANGYANSLNAGSDGGGANLSAVEGNFPDRDIASDKQPPYPSIDRNLRLAKSGSSGGEGANMDEQLQKFLQSLQKKEGKELAAGEALEKAKDETKANVHRADTDIWKILHDAHLRHQRKYSEVKKTEEKS